MPDYLATLSFDLIGASSDDYRQAYEDLAAMKFEHKPKDNDGRRVTLTDTTCVGEYNGESAEAVRKLAMRAVKSAFVRRGFRSQIFISVGDDWSWGQDIT